MPRFPSMGVINLLICLRVLPPMGYEHTQAKPWLLLSDPMEARAIPDLISDRLYDPSLYRPRFLRSHLPHNLQPRAGNFTEG